MTVAEFHARYDSYRTSNPDEAVIEASAINHVLEGNDKVIVARFDFSECRLLLESEAQALAGNPDFVLASIEEVDAPKPS